MVSFFGLKFGDKKKKSERSPETAQQQWKKVDQNRLGEGQYFGQGTKEVKVANGGARSIQRPDTAQSTRTPYTYDTHNLAAASMFNLSAANHGRAGSRASLKPHASEANIRGRFAANNGSSSSLALPSPAFGGRYRSQNGSSSSLAAPGPGFGSRLAARNGSAVSLALPGAAPGPRPGTANGRTKEWVNPLDVHFMRKNPTSPPVPKSPLLQSPQLPPTPKADSDNGSVFGAEADDVVDSIIAAVKSREEEANDQRRENARMMETARLEKERLERQRVAESKTMAHPPPPLRNQTVGQSEQQLRSPSEAQHHNQLRPRPRPSPENEASSTGLGSQGPIFRGNVEDRPGSRNGMVFRDTPEERPGSRGHFRGNPDDRPGSRGHFRGNPDERPSSRGHFRGNPDERPGSRGGMRSGPSRPNGSNSSNGSDSSNGAGAPAAPGSRGPPRRNPNHNAGQNRPNGGPPGSAAGKPDRRLDSADPRNGAKGPIAIHEGPPRHGPPTQGLPRPPAHAGHRRGPQGTGPPGPRGPQGPKGPPGARGPMRPDGTGSIGSGPSSTGSGSGSGRQDKLPDGPQPNGPRFRGPDPGAQRSQSPGPRPRQVQELRLQASGHNLQASGDHSEGSSPVSPAPSSPASLGPPGGNGAARSYSPAFDASNPYASGMGETRSQSPALSLRGLTLPRRQESGSSVKSPIANEPTLRELMAQSPEPMSPGTTSRSSDGGGVIEQFARPIIQSVQARRDTLTLNTPTRHSLSMEIEELEKSLVKAQQSQVQEAARASMSSSHYSDESVDSSIDELQPAPLQSSPPLASPLEMSTSPLEISRSAPREQSPMRGPLALRRGPRRPTLDEYGVPSSQLSNNTYRRDPTGGTISPLSPLSRSTTPLFHQPNRDLSRTPTFDGLDPPPPRAQLQTPTTIIEPGFKFDFGPTVAPPTPDSTTWPLPSPPSPAPHAETDPAMATAQPTRSSRPDPPPPLNLNFNFSPDASSRDPGLWTPPLKAPGRDAASTDDRPSTSQGFSSMLAPPLTPVFGPPKSPLDVPEEDAAATAAALGIGVARGLSVRFPQGRKVDEFGTGFI